MAKNKKLNRRVQRKNTFRSIAKLALYVVIILLFYNGLTGMIDRFKNTGGESGKNPGKETISYTSEEEKVTAKLEAILNANVPEEGSDTEAGSTGNASVDTAIDNSNLGVSVAELIYQNMTYQVTEVKSDGFTIEVTAPDVKKLFYSLFDHSEYSNPAEMEEYLKSVNQLLAGLSEQLGAGKYEKITSTLEVPLSETGDVEITYELGDALYGGLLSLQAELAEAYNQAADSSAN